MNPEKTRTDEAVSRTLSEIAAVALKAARGAGCPWGFAEEAGHAVRRLESHSLPGVETLANLLHAPRACPCSGRSDAAACGIVELACLSDSVWQLNESGYSRTDPVAGPLLLASPLLSQASITGRAYRLDADSFSLICSASGALQVGNSMSPPDIAGIDISLVEPPAKAEPADWRSRSVPLESWQRLEAFAAKTLVPESDVSRARGAGPGGSPND